MTTRRMTRVTIFALAAAAATLAHAADATDPAVKARQEAMETIGKNMKSIADMAKGKADFDAQAAGAAAAVIAETADKVPGLFETRADDPESEAKPAIWDDFGDFTEKSEALQAAAGSADMASLDALRNSVGEIGRTCKSCHDDYRVKN
ncbi:cytochrome c [Rhodovulum sulfidophilum]|uniref:Cytochrome c n=1 Tax=Rhodovulum sulfidophilum TaxID=35806 RepID=A0A0D6B7E0_RHOSU|nr:cytochrome c [Rhodovulum sulfidophilum]MBL3551785.1 cytochrome c [Rhodovulum sulfidophilum]MBL3563200.1 cytochrome c [Rhodovulum sulfidophilum]MBL3567366.1 cytochrome c [Rhodovulum sulfidophilum]MBL3574838.1 cytochrome c [Rhodovulum sulfidophilum]MBL3584919.1 cytochrome c [Rhodovulum sulfidophilum]